jgi:hypothetical protein
MVAAWFYFNFCSRFCEDPFSLPPTTKRQGRGELLLECTTRERESKVLESNGLVKFQMDLN